jgi:hypothetical protein
MSDKATLPQMVCRNYHGVRQVSFVDRNVRRNLGVATNLFYLGDTKHRLGLLLLTFYSDSTFLE